VKLLLALIGATAISAIGIGLIYSMQVLSTLPSHYSILVGVSYIVTAALIYTEIKKANL
jgi:hypothetical protein